MNLFLNKKYSLFANLVSVAIICFGLWLFFGDNFVEFLGVIFWIVFGIMFFVLYVSMIMFPVFKVKEAMKKTGYFSLLSISLSVVAMSFLSTMMSYYFYFPALYFLVNFFGGTLTAEGPVTPAHAFSIVVFLWVENEVVAGGFGYFPREV